MSGDIARLIAGGLLALICCYIGLLIKRRYSARVKFFKSATGFCRMLQDELSMRKTPMPEICAKFLDGRKGQFEDFLSEWRDKAKTKEGVDKDRCRLLKNDEIKDLNTFLCNLGKTDLKDQLSHVAHYEKCFEKKTSECEEQNKKTGSMYFKLCVLLGLAVILILA